MKRVNFTDYDEKPGDMINYLRYYGPHFNKKLCEFAVSLMSKEDDKPIKPFSREEVRTMMSNYGIQLKHDQLYDSTYVANMCKADFLGSSIEDEKHAVLYIKNVIDDPDAPDGIVFNRWYADMCYMGIAVDWTEML